MIKFISLKQMWEGRTISRSGETRLRKRYPVEYPPLFNITPNRVAATIEANDRFNQFLIDTHKKRVAVLAAKAEGLEADDVEADAEDAGDAVQPPGQDAATDTKQAGLSGGSIPLPSAASLRQFVNPGQWFPCSSRWSRERWTMLSSIHLHADSRCTRKASSRDPAGLQEFVWYWPIQPITMSSKFLRMT